MRKKGGVMSTTSVKDIAQKTGISISTVRRLCDKGMIDHKRDYKGCRWFPEPKRTIKQVKSLLNEGILRSWERGKSYNKDNPGIVIANKRVGARYICYWYENGKTKRVYHSRWLWEKHYGVIPKGYVIHHKDGNALNDSLDNLEILSHNRHIIGHRKGQGASAYQSWVSFLSKHNKMDMTSKTKIVLQVKYDTLEGKDVAKKLQNIYNKYCINQSRFSTISGISEAMLSKSMSGSRAMGEGTLIAVFDAIKLMDNIIKSKADYYKIAEQTGLDVKTIFRIKKSSKVKYTLEEIRK